MSVRDKTEMIGKLIQVTKEIISDCSLENGGIVAANSTKSYFPVNAKNYFYIWPRDAAYLCLASDVLGIKSIQKKFFSWCLNHAEGFKKTGLFYEKYYPNGLQALMNFQPDQTGTVLFAACNYLKNHSPEKNDPEISELITLAANGICKSWNGTHFKEITNDLWEERLCFPELEENFSYSLAACIKGLRSANEIFPDGIWLTTAEEMKNCLDNHFDDFFVRSHGKITDKRIDASIIGLVYPFQVYEANDPRIVASVKEIENRLIFNGGVHRYENDDYDGWMNNGRHMKKGAGGWPLLNFWMAIYYSLSLNKSKAEEYYYWVLDNIKDNLYIPEQIFSNDLQVSVSPLLWSHIMFILASEHLELI